MLTGFHAKVAQSFEHFETYFDRPKVLGGTPPPDINRDFALQYPDVLKAMAEQALQ
jgi:hypothetical protein